jgi:hypothetical protein
MLSWCRITAFAPMPRHAAISFACCFRHYYYSFDAIASVIFAFSFLSLSFAFLSASFSLMLIFQLSEAIISVIRRHAAAIIFQLFAIEFLHFIFRRRPSFSFFLSFFLSYFQLFITMTERRRPPGCRHADYHAGRHFAAIRRQIIIFHG